MISSFVFLALAALAPLVSAHGSLDGVFIDDRYIAAPQPLADSAGFPIRVINDINPVKGTSNPDMNCGHGAQPAPEVADASAGSVLRFAWRNGEGGAWVHNTGPVMTYMASCGSGGCANFDGSTAQFFKISELGKKDDGTWYMSDLNGALNDTTSATIPSDLPAGEYLVRHELIAMQLGMSQGGAEFYPACLQVRLGGGSNDTTVSATSLPAGTETVAFPGGYSDTDPGILDAHIYDPGFSYTFPGPPLINAASNSTATPSDVPANTSADSGNGTPTSSTATTATPVPNNNGCGYSAKKKRVVKRVYRRNPLVKKSATPAQKREDNVRLIPDYKRSNHQQPAVRSRIMRGI